MAYDDKRFEVVFKEDGGFSSSKQIILKDRETGVHYLVYSSGYGAAMTPLLDRDGKPVVDGGYGGI